MMMKNVKVKANMSIDHKRYFKKSKKNSRFTLVIN